MKKLLQAVLIAATLAPSLSAQVGTKAPVLEAVKWYNTPPLALEQMRDKTVLVEVFRTW